jgi:hypothetical protein
MHPERTLNMAMASHIHRAASDGGCKLFAVTFFEQRSLSAIVGSRLGVMCGRRLIGKSYFDVDAALVGCGHVSGLFVRRGWPLALMLCADQVPIQLTHSKMR